VRFRGLASRRVSPRTGLEWLRPLRGAHGPRAARVYCPVTQPLITLRRDMAMAASAEMTNTTAGYPAWPGLAYDRCPARVTMVFTLSGPLPHPGLGPAATAIAGRAGNPHRPQQDLRPIDGRTFGAGEFCCPGGAW
jgi:hypothetical protein